MKINCAGIVTYNPDLEILEKNINKLEVQVHMIIIVDNGSNNLVKIEKMICNHKKIQMIRQLDNLGVAAALNIIMNTAKKNGYLWVLTLDQDSIIEEGYVLKFENLCVSEKVAIMCPCILDRNRKIVDKGMGRIRKKNEERFYYADKCITSGAITNVNIWEKVGRYDEKLFIDYVDFDFCQRVRKRGYKILYVKEAKLIHSIGYGKIYKFFSLKIGVLNHDAKRKYFISRNRVYCDYKYHHAIGIAIVSNVKLITKTLIFENDKFNKCIAIIKGTHDGIRMIRAGE